MHDAYKTAPAEMGLIKLLLRMASTFQHGLYGKETFDAVVVGDDPLVSLCVALKLAREGKCVLLAPDTLGEAMWPARDWGENMLAIQNHFDHELAEELSSHLSRFNSSDGFQRALSSLVHECAGSGLVLMLDGDYIQSSRGVVKGGASLLFFRVSSDSGHAPTLNPLWKFVKRKVPKLAFNLREIEFIQAERLIYTSPVSAFVEASLGTPVGQARPNKCVALDRGGRADDVRSAFTIS